MTVEEGWIIHEIKERERSRYLKYKHFELCVISSMIIAIKKGRNHYKKVMY